VQADTIAWPSDQQGLPLDQNCAIDAANNSPTCGTSPTAHDRKAMGSGDDAQGTTRANASNSLGKRWTMGISDSVQTGISTLKEKLRSMYVSGLRYGKPETTVDSLRSGISSPKNEVSGLE